MRQIISLFFISLLMACAGGGFGGKKTDTYLGYTESGPINNYTIAEIQLRQLDMINAIRAENGLSPVQISAELTAAGFTHARDIAIQQRAWNFGSDKSTPQSRAQRTGFSGTVTGENISETYRGEIQVMQSWLNGSISRRVILNSRATHVGIAFYMENSGKVWWVQNFGSIGGL